MKNSTIKKNYFFYSHIPGKRNHLKSRLKKQLITDLN